MIDRKPVFYTTIDVLDKVLFYFSQTKPIFSYRFVDNNQEQVSFYVLNDDPKLELDVENYMRVNHFDFDVAYHKRESLMNLQVLKAYIRNLIRVFLN